MCLGLFIAHLFPRLRPYTSLNKDACLNSIGSFSGSVGPCIEDPLRKRAELRTGLFGGEGHTHRYTVLMEAWGYTC